MNARTRDGGREQCAAISDTTRHAPSGSCSTNANQERGGHRRQDHAENVLELRHEHERATHDEISVEVAP